MHYFSNERLFFKGLFPSVQRLPLLGSTHAVLGRGFFSLNSGQALYPQTPTSARDPGPKASPRFLHGSPGPAARSPGRRKHAAAPASGTRGPGQPGHGCAPGGTPRPWLCLPPAICPWSPSGPTEDEPLEKERHQAKGRDPRDRPLRTGSEAGSGTRGGLSPASSPPSGRLPGLVNHRLVAQATKSPGFSGTRGGGGDAQCRLCVPRSAWRENRPQGVT